MKLIGYTALFILICSACSSPAPSQECHADPKAADSLKTKTDPLKDALVQDAVVKPSVEQKANHVKIVAKYGEQWDFCTCVTANDSINNAFEQNITDKQAEKLMARWEHIETKCKEFLTNPNTTPEERALHEKKVKKCLRAAKN